MTVEVDTLHEVDTPVVLDALAEALGNFPADPRERAQARLERLQANFASSLAIVAQMHQDEDWKYLTRDDGTPYRSLAEVFSDVMKVSMSMARRYVQGATRFYLPLSSITVDGTKIEITSADVATLGNEGLEDAVNTARENLDGVDDPDRSSEIIEDALRSAHDRKSNQKSDDYDLGPGNDFDSYDPPRRENSQQPPSNTAAEDADWAAEDDMEDLPALDPGQWGEDGDWTPTGADSDGFTDNSPAALDDPVLRVLDGADDYSDPEKLGDLPEPLRSVTAALLTLAEMDTDAIARSVAYESRGVLLPVGDALANATRFRALVETNTWYVSRLTV